MYDSIEPKEWISIGMNGADVAWRYPNENGSFDSEVFDPLENFVCQLSKIAHIFDCLKPKVKGLFFESIPKFPEWVFSGCREFMFNRSVPMIGHDYSRGLALPAEVVDVSKREIHIVQKTYSSGPLAGNRIQQYYWFDDRFLQIEKTDEGFGLYTKRVVHSQADIAFLGYVSEQPKGYVEADFDFKRWRKSDYEFLDYIREYLKEVPPGRLALLKVTWSYGPVEFAIHDSGQIWTDFGNWIGKSAKLSDEQAKRINYFPFRDAYKLNRD